MKTWIMANPAWATVIAVAVISGVVWLIVYLTKDNDVEEVKEPVEPVREPIAEMDVERQTTIYPNMYTTPMQRASSMFINPSVSGSMDAGLSGGRVHSGKS